MRTGLFDAFVPGRDGAWDDRSAAHLLRRTGFGAPPTQIQQAVDDGLEKTVENLFDDADDQESQFRETFQRISGTLLDFGETAWLQSWWCYRMLTTRTPLREKLTLFWHGHFATSYNKVGDMFLMHLQNETLRKHAWGNFRDLVSAISTDPAMLVYLDGETSTKEHPNENFARELMELFTLGVGNYTESDVLEAARTFTGYTRDGARYVFNTDIHDDGRKKILGHAGRLKGEDVVDILMLQPATPKFIARKLLIFFANPAPTDEVVAEAAELFVQTRLNIEWFLRSLFASKYFYSEPCRRAHISSPAEFVIGTCRTLGVRLAASQLYEHVSAMGQELFAPPNVKGWDGERKWINSSALAARSSFVDTLTQAASGTDFGSHLDIARLVPADLSDPAAIVGLLVKKLFDDQLPQTTRGELSNFLVSNAEGPQLEQFRNDPGFREQQIRAVLSLMLNLPEYQVS